MSATTGIYKQDPVMESTTNQRQPTSEGGLKKDYSPFGDEHGIGYQNGTHQANSNDVDMMETGQGPLSEGIFEPHSTTQFEPSTLKSQSRSDSGSGRRNFEHREDFGKTDTTTASKKDPADFSTFGVSLGHSVSDIENQTGSGRQDSNPHFSPNASQQLSKDFGSESRESFGKIDSIHKDAFIPGKSPFGATLGNSVSGIGNDTGSGRHDSNSQFGTTTSPQSSGRHDSTDLDQNNLASSTNVHGTAYPTFGTPAGATGHGTDDDFATGGKDSTPQFQQSGFNNDTPSKDRDPLSNLGISQQDSTSRPTTEQRHSESGSRYFEDGFQKTDSASSNPAFIASPGGTVNFGQTQLGQEKELHQTNRHQTDQPRPDQDRASSGLRGLNESSGGLGTGTPDTVDALGTAKLSGISVNSAGDLCADDSQSGKQARSPGSTTDQHHSIEPFKATTTSHPTHLGSHDDSTTDHHSKDRGFVDPPNATTTGYADQSGQPTHSGLSGDTTAKTTTSALGNEDTNGYDRTHSEKKKTEEPVSHQTMKQAGIGPTAHAEPMEEEDEEDDGDEMAGGKPGLKDKIVGYAKKTRGTLLRKPEVKEAGQRILDGEDSRR